MEQDEAMSPALGLRERRRLETRRQIHESVVELSQELGYAHVTVDAISARAGISPRTFFNYFPSKEAAVILDPPVELRGAHAAQFAEGPEREPRELLVELTRALLDQLESDPPDRRSAESVFAIAGANPEVLTALIAQLDGVRAGLSELVARRLPAPADQQVADLIASLAMAAVRSGLETWAAAEAADDDSPVRSVRRAVEIMTSLAGTPTP